LHVNRLKEAHNPEAWKPKPERKFTRIQTSKLLAQVDEGEENEIKIGSIPLLKASRPEDRGTQLQIQC